MRTKMIPVAMGRLVCQVLKFAVFLDLDKFRLFSKVIDEKRKPQGCGEQQHQAQPSRGPDGVCAGEEFVDEPPK